MSRIKALLSKNANYIYHMLSVSMCGYNNPYGERYKLHHKDADLQILKKWEKHLTVGGGEHCGELYFVLVSVPASLNEDNIIKYFEALLDLFETGNLESNFKLHKNIYETAFSAFNIPINYDTHKEFFEAYTALKPAIIEISKVIIDNYCIYNEKVWEVSGNELGKAIDKINHILSEIDYAEKWEKALQCKYKYDNFFAVICNSIENGPQAIDISCNKDIFYLSTDYPAIVNFINHEFGIYLLKDILVDTQAFKDFTYYRIVESLAEYFNRIITGGHKNYDWFNEYINFYESLRDGNPDIGVREMFLKAKETFTNY